MEDGLNDFDSSNTPPEINFSWSKPSSSKPPGAVSSQLHQSNTAASPLIKFSSNNSDRDRAFRRSRSSLPSTFTPDIENETESNTSFAAPFDSDMSDSEAASPSQDLSSKKLTSFAPARLETTPKFRPTRTLGDSSNLTSSPARRTSAPSASNSRLNERLLSRKQQFASSRGNKSHPNRPSNLRESSVPSPIPEVHSLRPQSTSVEQNVRDLPTTSPTRLLPNVQEDHRPNSSNHYRDSFVPAAGRSQDGSTRISAGGSARGRSVSRAPTETTGQEKSVMAVQALADIVQENSSLVSGHQNRAFRSTNLVRL